MVYYEFRRGRDKKKRKSKKIRNALLAGAALGVAGGGIYAAQRARKLATGTKNRSTAELATLRAQTIKQTAGQLTRGAGKLAASLPGKTIQAGRNARAAIDGRVVNQAVDSARKYIGSGANSVRDRAAADLEITKRFFNGRLRRK